MEISLKSMYSSTLIPNSFIGQNEKRRSEWKASKIINRTWEGAETQHRYQIAKSPYEAEIHAHIKCTGDVEVSNTETFSFWNSPVEQERKLIPIELFFFAD
jgi:hypothetical protein